MPTTPPALTHLLRGLAVGRIALGGAALVAPGALARVLDIEATPELNYMSRIFAARAIALGTGYLTSPGEQTRWQRLSFMVDVTDTAHGAVHLVRGDLPRKAAIGMVG